MIFILCLFILFCPNPVHAKSLMSYFKDSSKLALGEKEKVNLDKLQRLNAQIRQELSREGQITEALNRICQGEIEKEVQANFMAVMTLRKTHNDQLLKHMKQKTFNSDNERRQMQRAYQALILDLSPEDMRKLPYIYPIILPLAYYAQAGCVKIGDLERGWFENERNFKYCFLYICRKQADLGRTHRNYSALCSKMGVSDRDGLAALTKFFNRDLNFDFFDQNFDSGIFNKESKFFGFEGYTFKYIKAGSQNGTPQSVLTSIFRTYCIHREHCKNCDLIEFYNKRKVGMFNDIVHEMTQGAASDAGNLEVYLKPLYYLSRTFPNMSAFLLTGKDGKFKFTDHVEKSPVWEELKSFWKNASAKEKDPSQAVNMIKYALGSICLLPQKEVLASDEEYTFDRSGYATYMQEYIAIYNKYQK